MNSLETKDYEYIGTSAFSALWCDHYQVSSSPQIMFVVL